MKVVPLPRNDLVYSANSYLVLGTWNHLHDINTLIDVGTDDHVVRAVNAAATGVGKRPVEQVILTHNHFDHMGGLPAVRAQFQPRVYAFAPGEGVDVLIRDREMLKIGDELCQIIHAPGHSSDSICVYSPSLHALFSGDVPMVIRAPGGTYARRFVDALEYIVSLDVRVVYSGHDEPLTERCSESIRASLVTVRNSIIVDAPDDSSFL